MSGFDHHPENEVDQSTMSAVYRQLDDHVADDEGPYDVEAGLERLLERLNEESADEDEEETAPTSMVVYGDYIAAAPAVSRTGLDKRTFTLLRERQSLLPRLATQRIRSGFATFLMVVVAAAATIGILAAVNPALPVLVAITVTDMVMAGAGVVIHRMTMKSIQSDDHRLLANFDTGQLGPGQQGNDPLRDENAFPGAQDAIGPQRATDTSDGKGGHERNSAVGSFWSSLTAEEQRAFTALSREKTFSAGAILFREGQVADHVIMIRSGWIKVVVGEDRHERIIAVRGPGDLVGERAALRVSSRTATVIALGTVQGLSMTTEDFAEFLEDHPRVLSVVERMVYERLTEGLGSSGRDHESESRPSIAGSTPSWSGHNCSILLTDIAGFGAAIRDEKDRLFVRRTMYEILSDALERSGIPSSMCYYEDRGDGTLIIMPPSVPTQLAVDPLLTSLAAALRRHNRRASEAEGIRLRIALNVGPVSSDPDGVSGDAIIQAARLLDAAPLRERLQETSADLVFIASTYVYDTVIRYAPGLVDPAAYQQVRVQAKGRDLTAWMYAPQDRPRDRHAPTRS
jgi:CRP-like cAMP-binding protein